jgi:hypothetical protein
MQLGLAAVAWSGDFGRPTLFNVAIACGLKLPFKDLTTFKTYAETPKEIKRTSTQLYACHV